MEFVYLCRKDPYDGVPYPQNDPVWRPKPMQHDYLHSNCLKEECQ